MAERDIFDYVYEWMEENIELQSYVDEEGDDRPQQFSQQFLTSAESEGFSAEDIASIRDRLPDIVGKYMTQQTDAEVRRLAAADD
jgi:hypothetical protein